MRKTELHAYILITLTGTSLIGMLFAKPLTIRGRPRTDFSGIPIRLNGWRGTAGSFDEGTKRLLRSCSLLLRSYSRSDHAAPVQLAIVYGTDLGDFHQPEWCLQGQGLRIVAKRNVTISPEGSSPFSAVLLVTDSAIGKQVFVFWFESRGRTATFLGNQKIEMLRDRLLDGRVEPSAMIRLSTEVKTSEEEAIATLVEFGAEFYPHMEKELSPSTANGTDER